MGMPTPLGPGVTIEWDEAALRRYFDAPRGTVGRELIEVCGEAVAARARRLALRRTGKMAREITCEVTEGEGGPCAIISSPAVNEKTGFPYPKMHEGPRTRDRRPHRSLVPALNEVNRIL
jgi:hypothetical protein